MKMQYTVYGIQYTAKENKSFKDSFPSAISNITI
jgi:hypothetical protein